MSKTKWIPGTRYLWRPIGPDQLNQLAAEINELRGQPNVRVKQVQHIRTDCATVAAGGVLVYIEYELEVNDTTSELGMKSAACETGQHYACYAGIKCDCSCHFVTSKPPR